MAKTDRIGFAPGIKRLTKWQQRMAWFRKRATRSRRRKDIQFESRRRNRQQR